MTSQYNSSSSSSSLTDSLEIRGSRQKVLGVRSLPGVLLADGDVLQHVLGGAHGHGGPLVDALGLDVQDVLEAGGGHASCLLHDVRHRVAFIQQPQLGGDGGGKGGVSADVKLSRTNNL